MLINGVIDIERLIIEPKLNEEIEGLGSGQVLRAQLTTPLWSVTATTCFSTFQEGRRIRALINSLNRPGVDFTIFDPIAEYPINDPGGTILTGSTITIAGVDGQGRVSFSGAPTGFQFSAGDYFHFDFSGRRYFIELSANGTGSAYIQTFPRMPTGSYVGTAATFIRPEMKVQFVPGSLTYGAEESASWKMGGFQLRMIQKL